MGGNSQFATSRYDSATIGAARERTETTRFTSASGVVGWKSSINMEKKMVTTTRFVATDMAPTYFALLFVTALVADSGIVLSGMYSPRPYRTMNAANGMAE